MGLVGSQCQQWRYQRSHRGMGHRWMNSRCVNGWHTKAEKGCQSDVLLCCIIRNTTRQMKQWCDFCVNGKPQTLWLQHEDPHTHTHHRHHPSIHSSLCTCFPLFFAIAANRFLTCCLSISFWPTQSSQPQSACCRKCAEESENCIHIKYLSFAFNV